MGNEIIGGILGGEVERGLRRQAIVEALAKEAGAKCTDKAETQLLTVTWSSTDLPAFVIDRKESDAG